MAEAARTALADVMGSNIVLTQSRHRPARVLV